MRVVWAIVLLACSAAIGCRPDGNAASGSPCHARVLVLTDDPGAAALMTAISADGMQVSSVTTPASDYDGVHPKLAGFDALLLIPGVQQASVQPDMPAEGQKAIADFVAAGHGLVLTEWAAYHLAAQPTPRWQTLKPLVLLHRQASFSGTVTWQVDPAYAQHPLWAGLPPSFSFTSVSNVGALVPGPGVARVASSPQALDAVAIRDGQGGRVVHLAHAGMQVPGGWMNINLQRIVSNAAAWASRCR